MIEVKELKNGSVFLECECGLIHIIQFNSEKNELEVKTKYTKKVEQPKIENPKEVIKEVPKIRNSVFGY